MKTREEFKKGVIELIHGVPYEEAIEKEIGLGCIVEIRDWYDNFDITSMIMDQVWIPGEEKHIQRRKFDTEWVWKMIDKQLISKEEMRYKLKYPNGLERRTKPLGLPITIGRVIQALENKRIPFNKNVGKEFNRNVLYLCNIWDFPEFKKSENGREYEDDDQTDETIKELYELIK